LWILDDASPIAEWTPAISQKRAHLFAVPRATLMIYWEDVSNMNHYFFTAENPAEGAAFTYYLGQPAQKIRFIVTNAAGKTVRELTGPTDAGVIHRINWDLRYTLPPGAGARGAGGGGGEEGGERGGPGSEKPGQIQLPVPAHEIGPRGPHVAPGTFKVSLEVDGVVTESRNFEIRSDPASTITSTQHKAREAFVEEVMALQAKVEDLAANVAKRRTAAGSDEASRLQAIEQRLVGGGQRGQRGGGGGSQPMRTRLNALITTYVGNGARQGTMAAPTSALKQALADAKTAFAAIEKEAK
jgi:hypothetical protein